MPDNDVVYDTDSIAKPATEEDLVRDSNGFTHPNLHRRIHPVNGLPFKYTKQVNLTWKQAKELNYTWNNSAGLCTDYFESDYNDSMAVITPEQESETAMRDIFPIVVTELPSDPKMYAIYEFEGQLLTYAPNDIGVVEWMQFKDANGDCVLSRQSISPKNVRKSKKGAPSKYILNIQSRDSYRREIDDYTSSMAHTDTSHNEIP